ncbi:MAG: AI-2E family transporter [Lentisphaerota bacterium]
MADEEHKTSRIQSILSSSAGFIAAIVIIVIFILAATFFKPVVFGLLLAYLFLPIQSFYRNYLLKNKVFIYISFLICYIFAPITKPAKAIKTKFLKYVNFKIKKEHPSEEERAAIKLVKRSCILTTLTVFILLILALTGITWLSTTYIANTTKSISMWAQKTTTDYEKNKLDKDGSINLEETNADGDEGSIKQFMAAVHYKIEALKPKLEKYKVFAVIKEYIGANLSSPKSIQDLIKQITNKSGGIFSYTAGMVGTLFFIILKLVFTFFFFAFFLNKLAYFNCTKNHKVSTGEYLTDAIMESSWFPNTKEGTRETAANILDNIMFRLKMWVRGYFIIIIIESCFYVAVFTLIGVPFGLILGLIAGFTILLPYIGPIVSAFLTVAICFASGEVSMTQIFLVLIAYIFMTGILDQLFIYPAVVGASLGLNELETIVVVLLGGMFFGITGMIFAVPTTSILKYLIPEIYKLIEVKRQQSS